ncbi:MAG: DUF1553 domain-containing protein [Pirellulales bacterium]
MVRTTLHATASVAIMLAIGLSARADERLEYNDAIRPILADACFACHGPDSASREADLRLDQRAAAIELEAITPGDPDASEMIRRIVSTDPDEVMPPPETKKTLNQAQKEWLIRWVRQGAEYQSHWSFIPPKRPRPPAVKDRSWMRNPIDQFVAARLEASGLAPASEADRRTLARRVCLDLTGLPPTPKMVDVVINDPSPNAYEKLVDTLLESQHWGEHRGRYWLDYARYADTHGIHFDNYREMWTYRDWVIDALNQNMPFDQFTIENLAGDLLPDGTLAQRIGSGFNRCNMTTNEGGIIDEEYRVLYTRDRTETTAQVWLGLTAGCAVCHDHKYDPLSQREFYQMAAFFNNTTQAARDGNVQDTPPVVVVPREEDRQRWEELPSEIAEIEKSLQTRRGEARSDFDRWLAEATAATVRATSPTDQLHLHARLDEGAGTSVGIRVDGELREVPLTDSASWQAGRTGKAIQAEGAVCELADVGDFEKDQAFTCATWVRLPANDGHGAICARMDSASAYQGWDLWMQRRQVGMHLIHAWPQDGLKVVAKKQVPANRWVHVAVSYDGSGKASGVKIYYDGKAQKTNVENDKLSGSIKTAVPFKIGQRNAGDPLSATGLQDLRVYGRLLSPSEVESLARLSHLVGIVAKAAEKRNDQEKEELFNFWIGAFDQPFRELTGRRAEREQQRSEIKARGTIAHVMQEKPQPAKAYLLFRGEYNKRRDEVAPDTPEMLPPFPDTFPRNRLGFARWLLLPDHPLTARVTVNRFWQEVFGTGIVKTPGDFGVSGAMPSHPELLDWLAVEFRESGWNVKRLFKLMVMSATYRQSAATTPEKIAQDPENRLLSRGPRFRMDAEMVRDYALVASGLMVPKVGGPSVKPYQPSGVWEAIAMNVSNTRSYQRDTGDDLYRRSLYTFIKRMAPPASMDIFNAPNREYCVVARSRTNTPLQALVTLNDEQFVEAARHLAAWVIRHGGATWEGRLQQMGQRLLAREFRPDESQIIEASFQQLRTFYRAHADEAKQLVHVGESQPDPQIDVPQLAAWTMLANELMNLDEVLNK